MSNEAESRVSTFYNTLGWETDDGVTEDARRWEDLRPHVQDYVVKTRLRVDRHIPKGGEAILDMASGPIQFPEYVAYSRNFRHRYCVDLSTKALESAKRKIGDHGVFLHGSFFEIPFEEDSFDCAISLHTIYHMDKDRQEEAVRKLVSVTKPGQPVIIVYANPNNFLAFLEHSTFLRRLGDGVKKLLGKGDGSATRGGGGDLYYFAHPVDWWARFDDVAQVQILPWRSLRARTQRMLIPNNRLGAAMLAGLYRLEERFPDFFVKHFQYPMIILKKRS